MAEKLTAVKSVRLTEEEAQHVDEFRRVFAAEHGLSITDSQALRNLCERGYRAWKHEREQKKKRSRLA